MHSETFQRAQHRLRVLFGLARKVRLGIVSVLNAKTSTGIDKADIVTLSAQ